LEIQTGCLCDIRFGKCFRFYDTGVHDERTDGDARITTVRQFLAGIENHDLESQLRYLTPDAQAYRLRNGKWIVSQVRDVLISGAKGGGALSAADASKSVSEPIDEIGSKTFDQIATVWTHYQFLVEGKVITGVILFTR
jgi:hypothetical protein